MDTRAYLKELQRLLGSPKSRDKLYNAVVNAPFHDPMAALEYDLGVLVLLLVNHKTKTIDRIALSDTYSAKGAVQMSAKPFKDIKIPVGHKTNLIAQAIETGKPQQTSDWQYLFTPALTAKEAHFNQAGAGIEASVIYPLDKPHEGALIFSCYQPLDHIDTEHKTFMKTYASLVSKQLSRL